MKSIELVLLPHELAEANLHQMALDFLGISADEVARVIPKRRSIDARGRLVKIRLLVDVFFRGDEVPAQNIDLPEFKQVADKQEVYVIGYGPAGIFAALELIQLGLKPIIIERGKNVRERRFDLAKITREGEVNPESNYCFGEGGAGTYSDGKLYTRSGKRGNIEAVLKTFVAFGANADILLDAHPHIGTNKLPGIIQAISAYIIACGAEIRFNTKLTDIKTEFGKLKALQFNNNEWVDAQACILATGHSARDIFELLHNRGILIEAKPFALGVRIEHPQQVIDQVQYHCDSRGEFLPPASYSLVGRAENRGVYSFCMCPGGIIAPCSTNPNEVVTNGWSPSKRNNPFANSGMVVELQLSDFKEFEIFGPLAGLKFQSAIEQRAFQVGGGRLQAPAVRLMDFLDKRVSSSLPNCSYIPGIVSSDLADVFPAFITNSLRLGLQDIGSKMRPYLINDAVLVATESRTSSPVRIPRDKETLQHPEVVGLFPCGEGAGYAGGIVSAAMDGTKIAQMVLQYIKV